MEICWYDVFRRQYMARAGAGTVKMVDCRITVVGIHATYNIYHWTREQPYVLMPCAFSRHLRVTRQLIAAI